VCRSKKYLKTPAHGEGVTRCERDALYPVREDRVSKSIPQRREGGPWKDRTLTAQGFTLLDILLRYRWRNVERLVGWGR
jgi:hypothetical protein